METGISKRLPASFMSGIVCLCLAILVLTFSGFREEDGVRSACFLMNHLILLAYFFLVWIGGYLKPNPDRRKIVAIFVLLLLVDAYTVNMVMSVFDATTLWFVIILVIMGANILAFSWFEAFPEWVKCLQCGVLGFTFLAPVYLACYLLSMYLISIIGLIAIGISLVTFSPIFVIWFHTRMVRILVWPVYRFRVIYLITMGLAVMVIAAYSFLYATKVNAMDRIYRQTTTNMPGWIRVAQEPLFGPVTEMILKTNIIYTAPDMDAFGIFEMPKREYDSEVKHDPLFVLSTFLFGRTSIPEEDRINILNVAYDKRHFAEERLWSGKHLSTTDVNTRVDLWPQYHLAYTENTIVVSNEDGKEWGLRNEEAIYTFHLPEGGVVTSLSLWMNDKEEKGILTTKQKADSAYKEIVGHQYRDPSVVHWQEGNRVVVRVFPVVPRDKRKFKIGITAPLAVKDGQLLYQPTWFEGPPAEDATYNVTLNMQQWPKEMTTPSGFFHDKGNRLSYLGNYHTDWELKIPNESINNAAFNFNGQRYTLLPYTPAYEFFTPANYYLDVNQNWHYEDYQKIITRLENKPVWVFHPEKGMVAVNAQNKKALFEDLQQFNFSVFPFHQIPQPATAMVIAASGQTSPQLSDLGATHFEDSLRACFRKQRIRLYDIGTTLSPYLATLKESRSLIYEKGTTEQLLSQISKNSFLKPEEDSSQLIMPQSGIRIARSTDSTRTSGPDHLARLFAYNYILQELGPRVTASDAGKDSLLVQAAKEAYVVTPLSSLIVLETQADYDQFGIKDDGNTLKNASLKGHGAVPEPHEWALFIVAVALLTYVRFEKLLFRKKEKAC